MHKLIKIGTRDHVITPSKRVYRSVYIHFDGKKEPIPMANYQETGMALCGILKPGETLDEWKVRTNKVKIVDLKYTGDFQISLKDKVVYTDKNRGGGTVVVGIADNHPIL